MQENEMHTVVTNTLGVFAIRTLDLLGVVNLPNVFYDPSVVVNWTMLLIVATRVDNWEEQLRRELGHYQDRMNSVVYRLNRIVNEIISNLWPPD